MKKAIIILISGFLLATFWLYREHSNEPTSVASLYWGMAQEGLRFSYSSLEKTEKTVELPLSFLEFFLMWPKDPQENLSQDLLDSLKEIWSFGAVPVLTWEPMVKTKNGNEVIFYQKILMGSYDSYLFQMADLFKQFSHPILVRFAHEMNLVSYHWGTTKENFGPDSPQIYIKMFQYVEDFFKKQGVDQILWVFCPNHVSDPSPIDDPSASFNHPMHYYPGDDYVDILGMDGYNWGSRATQEKEGWQSSSQSFKELFSLIQNELRNISLSKPLFVFETGTVLEKGQKNEWLKKALKQAIQWKLDGIIYFQMDKEQNWSLSNKDTRGLDRYFSKRPLSQQWTEEIVNEKK